MAMLAINSYEDFATYLGKEMGVSPYLTISQSQISQFADATLDHQWIHTDQPVTVGASVRLRVKLNAIANLRGIAKAELQAVMEIMDNPKPAFSATIILLYHFK